MKLSPAQKRALQIVAEDGITLVSSWGGDYWIWKTSDFSDTRIRWVTFSILRDQKLIYQMKPSKNPYQASEGRWEITEAGRQALLGG